MPRMPESLESANARYHDLYEACWRRMWRLLPGKPHEITPSGEYKAAIAPRWADTEGHAKKFGRPGGPVFNPRPSRRRRKFEASSRG